MGCENDLRWEPDAWVLFTEMNPSKKRPGMIDRRHTQTQCKKPRTWRLIIRGQGGESKAAEPRKSIAMVTQR